MIIDIDKKQYNVSSNEFNNVTHNEYNNLILRDAVGLQERIISLLNELSQILNIKNGIFVSPTHGGFIPINCSNQFENIYILNNTDNTDILEHKTNIEANILLHKLTNILFTDNIFSVNTLKEHSIIYSEKDEYIDTEFVEKYNPVILSTLSSKLLCFKLLNITSYKFNS